MPGKSNKPMPSRKVNKGRKRAPRGQGLLPMVTMVPSSKRIVMTYADANVVSEAAAGLGGTKYYRLNSPYDPDASGVGAVATGYNTWAGLFLNYKVKRATVRFQGVVRGMTAGSLGTVYVTPVPGQAVVPSNKLAWYSIRGCHSQAVPNVTEGGNNVVNFAFNVDNAWVAEVTNTQYANDMDFSGQIGSNPARQNYLLVAVSSAASGAIAVLSYTIEITYECEWFNPTPMQ